MKDKTWVGKNLSKILFSIFLLSIFLYIIVIIFYFSKFNGSLSLDHQRWGTFGDYLGGTLNPLFSFLGLIALLFALLIQNKELATSLKALQSQSDSQKNQTFERLFFELIRLHIFNLNETNIRLNENEVLNGRKCIEFLYRERLQVYFNDKNDNFTDTDNYEEAYEILLDSYELMYSNSETILKPYFSNLYHIFNLIEISDVDKKEQYRKILFNQLSKYEILLLVYDSLKTDNRNLINNIRSNILIDDSSLLNKIHIKFINT